MAAAKLGPRPSSGSRWVSWKGTTWLVVGDAQSGKREVGELMVTVRCVGRSARTRYPLGTEMDVALSWFGSEAQPESTGR